MLYPLYISVVCEVCHSKELPVLPVSCLLHNTFLQDPLEPACQRETVALWQNMLP